jgi:2-polyprenyl-6-hydroxyphenyl methylase / 3-demethylubiquinone-9 3-methyltransferase
MPTLSHPELPKATSIDPTEVAKFSAMADAWWDPKGKFRPLHQFNPVRLGFIRQMVEAHFALDTTKRRPFEGLRFLDIGCGGGLLSEPMCRLGAQMTSVDASKANVKTAQAHAQKQGLHIDYRHGAAEDLPSDDGERFDVILNMEVIEHTHNPALFLRACAKLLRPGGLMIIATINRTPKARLLAINMAENILRWLPRGTHDYEKLVRPAEIREPLEAADLSVEGPIGVSYNPIGGTWRISNDSAVNYMMVAKKAP